MKMAIRIGVSCLLSCLAFHGCSFGPKTIQQGHLAYNEGVKAAADDELLLNIVRLRYLDTIEFLAANAISAQTAMTVGLGAELGVERAQGSVLALPSISYSDRPTFTFTPQRGVDFAKRLVEPIAIDTLAHLAASDWPIHRLMRLLVTEVNGLVNEPFGNTEQFNRVARLLWDMQYRGDLLVGFVERREVLSDPIPADAIRAADLISAANSGYRFRKSRQEGRLVLTRTRPAPVMWIDLETGEGVQLKQSLHLKDQARPPFDLQLGAGLFQRESDYRSIILRTRSLLGAIVYLSQGVDPPAEHLARGLTTRHWPLPGMDAVDLTDFFQVHASGERPAASLAVKYRGVWFYVDETDLASKSTFLILAEFYRLAISEGRRENVPLLTLPVGGP